MSNQPEFSLVSVSARIADLEFTYLRPANFQVIDLPNERPPPRWRSPTMPQPSVRSIR